MVWRTSARKGPLRYRDIRRTNALQRVLRGRRETWDGLKARHEASYR